MNARLKLALIGSVFCSACTVGPKYQKPVVQAPPAFKEFAGSDQWKTATPSDGSFKGKWWEIFGDPQLNDFEERISLNNFNVKQAEAQFRVARSIILGNRANYFPVIGSSPAITQGDTARGTTSNFQIPFTASWEPDLWGRVRLAVENANANAQVSAADLENLRLSLQATLALDYFTLLSTDMQITLLDDTIKAYQTYLTLTINRFNGGVASRADVTLAQTQLYTTQAAATDLRTQRNQLEHAIAVLTGRAPSELAIPAGRIQNPPPPIPVVVPSVLLERRPDIAAQERLVAAANAGVGLAETAFYPTLTLSATAGIANPGLANLFTWASRVWSTGPQLSQTLFDFGRRNATLEGAQANYDAAVAAYRQTVLTAFQQVEDNLSNLKVLTEEAQQQAQAVAAAEQALQLETDRYKAGTDSYLNVITTQTIALNDERTAVALLQRRMTSAVDLILALGGGWDSSTLPNPDQLRSVAMGDPANTKNVAQPVAK
ncbi:MAG TPA: efflux transporter outer membrane subunit [Bryobacteraceae bacterium]|nr:efflux transporter outer membrane subunit [Bryobacteraceae bacterium]